MPSPSPSPHFCAAVSITHHGRRSALAPRSPRHTGAPGGAQILRAHACSSPSPPPLTYIFSYTKRQRHAGQDQHPPAAPPRYGPPFPCTPCTTLHTRPARLRIYASHARRNSTGRPTHRRHTISKDQQRAYAHVSSIRHNVIRVRKCIHRHRSGGPVPGLLSLFSQLHRFLHVWRRQ